MEILRDAIDGRHRSVLRGPTGLHRYRILRVFLLEKKEQDKNSELVK